MFLNFCKANMSFSGTYGTASFARPEMSSAAEYATSVGAMILASIFAFWVVLDKLIIILLLSGTCSRDAIV